MTILLLISAWVAIFIGYVLFLRIRENVRAGKPWFDFGKSSFLVASIGVFALAAILLNIVHPEPEFRTPDDQIAFGVETKQPWVSNEALWEKIADSAYNIDDHFQLVRNHYAQSDRKFNASSLQAYKAEEEKMFSWYTDLSQSTDSKLHDIGHVMLADMLLSQPEPDYPDASLHLRLIDDPTTKYVNYNAARIMLFGAGSDLAEEHLYSEIRNKGYKKGAYEYLAVLYEYYHRDSMLRTIVYSGAAEYISPEIRSRVYYEDNNLSAFFSLKIRTLLGGISWWALLGATAILMVWMYVLSSLGNVSGMSYRNTLIPLFAGAALSMLSWWLYAAYRFGLGFSLNGTVLNDFVFCVTGIGFIEELVKLIPFIIILRFTNIIRKPIDYIIVASSCGLGFAVFENLMYISTYGLDVIHSRALTSSVSHMACSGIVAYGFILYRYRRQKQFWLIPVFFILAATAHGFYDFWLVNEKVRAYGIITLFFYLSEILVYFSFISNALNQSVQEEDAETMARFDAGRVTSVFAGAMVLLFAFEYIAIAIVYGTTYSNSSILNAFLGGGYLIFFLAIRLAQLRIEPQRWNRIDFLSGILPSQMFGDRPAPGEARGQGESDGQEPEE